MMRILFNEIVDGDGGAPGGAATPPVETPPEGIDWGKIKESLPEDIRGDSSLSTITSLEGLAKSYIHAQKAIGRGKISVPDKHATEGDWKNVFSQLGVPEKIEDYKLSLEDATIDPQVLDKVKSVAHQKGILPWQFESVVKEFSKIAGEMLESQQVEMTASHEKNVNALKTEWGQAFDKQVERANAAMRHLLPKAEDQQALIDSGFGDNPAILRLLANASKLMSEDQFVGTGDGKLVMAPNEALEKAKVIQADPNHPYRNTAHPNHRAAKEEVQRLYAIAFPE